ncbi:MAG: cytochrome P450, partial [Myxococcales bacterium]|nr:cytochrome P450 [Myxococcales bacterium]
MRIAELPGPRGLPVVGNSLQIPLQRLHLRFEDWVDEFGPIYRVGVGPRPAVVIADHLLIRDALKRRPEQLRRQSSMQTVAREFGFDGLFTSEGQPWRRQRKLLNAAFAPQHIR